MKYSASSIIFLISLALISCQNGNKIPLETKQESNTTELAFIEIQEPFNGDNFTIGNTINIAYKQVSDTDIIDSVRLSVNSKRIVSLKEVENYSWETKNELPGKKTISIEAFSKGKSDIKSIIIHLLSDIKPVEYTYKVIKTYPHSRDAYTQGLIFENGYFYESDGQYGKSSLRKVKLETGEAINFASIDPKVFGEGIALYKNKIYQISWREQACFVYDKETLKQEQRFSYSMVEGWGLEFNGKNFLMTDGSNNIYFLDPEGFTQVDKIEVMSDKGAVDNLNELELIKGNIYANVYTQDYVVIIDPKTGKVIGIIDFSGLLPKKDYNNTTDVLNGIALNPKNGNLFVTGKNWPKLFEVAIVPKKKL